MPKKNRGGGGLPLSGAEKKRRNRLCEKYHNGKITIHELAEKMGIRKSGAYYYYRRNYRPHCSEKKAELKRGRPILSDEEKKRRDLLCEKYHNGKISISELTEKMGIALLSARTYYYNRYRYHYFKKGERKKTLYWSTKLIMDNIDQNQTISENARRIGYNFGTIKRVVQEMGIKLPNGRTKNSNG